jgi:hypothetical protein
VRRVVGSSATSGGEAGDPAVGNGRVAPESVGLAVVSVVAGTGRIVIRATNELMFCDKSLAPLPTSWPKGLRRQISMPSVEGLEAHKMATEATNHVRRGWVLS